MTKSNIVLTSIIGVIVAAAVGYGFYRSNQYGATSKQTSQNQVSNQPDRDDNKMMHDMSDGGSMMGANHMAKITGDKDFIENMIPHHQEAITSSQSLLGKTQNPELKLFLQNVIEAQTKEVNQMKTWYKDWFGVDYQDKQNYMAMMPDFNKFSGVEADKAYIKGMIEHHKAAVDMAKQIQAITKRPELLKLASDIIANQSSEIVTLEKWLQK
jgi:uncharacterized protein (DUF305 family)